VPQPTVNASLQELAQVVGAEGAREIVRLFLHDFPESIRRLGSASHVDQLRIIHGIKSSALHMGARQLSERLAEVEDRLAAHGASVLPIEIAGIVSDFGEVLPQLRKYASG
jgi:HPt (histidine-containing phosphotransfer) domain-containing protein